MDIQPSSWYTDIQPEVAAVIGSVAPGMPAYRAGLREGDTIIAVGGVEVSNWYEMRDLISSYEEDQVELMIEREGELFVATVSLETSFLTDGDQKMIGITQQAPVSYFQRYGLLDSVKYGAISSITFIAVNYYALFRLITKPVNVRDQIGGPVMIVEMSRQTTTMGWGAIIAFVASISLILMIMNLLPIPVLDGGHIFFYIIEGVTGKPLSYRVQALIQQIGFMIIIALMIFVFYNDISRLLGRNLALKNQQQEIEMIEEPGQLQD